MANLRYPAQFVFEEGAYAITFRDLPDVLDVAEGDSIEERLEEARIALICAIRSRYLDLRRPVPMPSVAIATEYIVELPQEVSAAVSRVNDELENGY
jgi:predicted RNase H-like HicB family nuclease